MYVLTEQWLLHLFCLESTGMCGIEIKIDLDLTDVKKIYL